jgi:two-component system, NarL family, nitrate/nitrite response regulator NarL
VECANVAKGLDDAILPPVSKMPRDAYGLTRRELEVVGRLAAGFTNREIAGDLAISGETVKRHLRHIFDKLGASNRLEVALFAVHHGLIDRVELEPASTRARNGRR